MEIDLEIDLEMKYGLWKHNSKLLKYGFIDEYLLGDKLRKILQYSNQRMDELESRVSLLEEHNALLLAKIDSLQKGHNSQEDDHSQDHLEASKMNITDGGHLPLDTMQ